MKYRRDILCVMTLVFFALTLFCWQAIYGQPLNGKWVHPRTMTGRVFADSSNSFSQWFPVDGLIKYDDTDSTFTLDNSYGSIWTGGSAGVDTTFRRLTFTFDADGGSTGDDFAYATFCAPINVEDDSINITLYWFHLDSDGATTDDVVWQMAYRTENSAETVAATNYTSLTNVTTTCSGGDNTLYLSKFTGFTIEPEDLISLKFGVDESESELDANETADLMGIRVDYYFNLDYP